MVPVDAGAELMSVRACFVLPALIWLGMATLAHAASCDHPVASASLHFISAKASGPGASGDSGVQPSGFVGLKSGEAVVQGVDISKLQDETDLETAFSCGAVFAYVQLSSGTDETDHSYRLYWPNARAAGLLTGPVHSLNVEPAAAKTWYAAAASGRPALYLSLSEAASGAGKAQADLFLSRLDEVLSSEITPSATGPGVQYLPIALDVTADPLPDASAADKAQFGQIYAAVACGFVAQVRANPKTSQAQLILFAEPGVFAAYRLGQNSCGLERLTVWISYHTSDGDRYDAPSAAADAASISALCRPGGAADRCKLQQYSSAASFAVFQPGAHLHLDRFYGSPADLKVMLQTYP
jgi:hypothetical protein